MTTARYPFGFDGHRKLGGIPTHKVYTNIRQGHECVKFPEMMSPELKALVCGILTVNPSERWDIPKIKACAWMQGMRTLHSTSTESLT